VLEDLAVHEYALVVAEGAVEDPAFAVGLQVLLLQLKRTSLTGIEKAWDNLDRLKVEIEEGFR